MAYEIIDPDLWSRARQVARTRGGAVMEGYRVLKEAGFGPNISFTTALVAIEESQAPKKTEPDENGDGNKE